MQEVTDFCDEQNTWFVPISDFISQWTEKSALEWKGKPARAIETILNTLKSWSDKVSFYWLICFFFKPTICLNLGEEHG